MVAESLPPCVDDAVSEAKAALLQAFGSMGGVTARAGDFASVVPGCGAAAVSEALEVLVEEGSVEVASLADGTPVYHFARA
jgi:hypothetical protein